jgi:hypothetical protein
MIIAEVGSIPKVRGKSIEMVPTGPIPGRTPIRVPMKTPIKQYNRLAAEKATCKPNERFPKKPDKETTSPEVN